MEKRFTAWFTILTFIALLSLTHTAHGRPTALADIPLLASSNVPANVLFLLSTEYPLAEYPAHTFFIGKHEFLNFDGAIITKHCPEVRKYRIGGFGDLVREDLCYFREASYTGYFDPRKCYDYNKTIISSTMDQTRGAFVPVGFTNTFHECRGRWSGNYLNWAITHISDGLRLALTGGNRSVDTATLTILEKARLTAKLYRQARIFRVGGSSYTENNATVTPVDRSTVTPYPSKSNSPLYLRLNEPTGQLAEGVQIQISEVEDFSTAATFYARAKVCDKNVGLEKNCKKFGSSFKPVGLIQENSELMRFGVGSYLVDSKITRAGGVLRARLKYTGPGQYVPGKAYIANSHAEWSAVDGRFLLNPDPADAAASFVPNSGVINYINKFGKASGYKKYDAVSELYYEMLRYLRNQSPTPEYTNDITAEMKDAFPVITNWDDPIQFSCQQNFIITAGDSSTWCDTFLPGNLFKDTCSGHAGAPRTPDPAIDVGALTNKVGLLEGMGNLGSISLKASQWNSFYIAGLAYWANVNDIRPAEPAKRQTEGRQTVQSFFLDLLSAHPVSASREKKQFWLGAKYGGFDDINRDGKPANEKTFDKNDDGIPDNYFNFGRVNKTIGALNKTFETIAAKTSTVRGVGVGAGTIISNVHISGASTGNSAYQTSFTTGEWHGDVIGGNLVINDGSKLSATFTRSWSARDALNKLAAGSGWMDKRKIVTMSGGRAVVFVYDNLTPEQRQALGKTADEQTDMVEYLRGNKQKEGTNFRVRSHLLGDIVHSKAIAVGEKTAPYHEATNPGYATFKTQWRKKMVYVGANDGMLHAFNGETDLNKDPDGGKEVWAYIPSFVISGASNKPTVDGLAAYASRAKPYLHHFYVDRTPEVRDLDFSQTKDLLGTKSAPNWRTILIGGLGKGGRGFYALDVTDGASALNESAVTEKVLWEFTDDDMGFSYGRPTIVKTARDGWVVLLTSGYNNLAGKNRGQGFLYILNAKTGKLIEKIGTGAGNANMPSGLAHGTAYIENSADFTSREFYAGDLNGNLWRFDLSIQQGRYPKPVKMATLTDAAGKPQPITIAPRVVIARNQRDRWVLIGTGKELAADDTLDSQQQTMYAIRDGDNEKPAPMTKALNRSQLKALSNITSGIPVPEKGWLYDLTGGNTTTGRERIIVDLEAHSGIVTFIGKTKSSDPCAPGGIGTAYAVDIETGMTALQDEYGKPAVTFSGNGFVGATLVLLNRDLALLLTDAEGKLVLPSRKLKLSR